MDGPVSLSFLAEAAPSRVPVVFSSIHTVSYHYFCTHQQFMLFLFFEQGLGSADNLDALNAELNTLQAARKKELRQKTKLLGKIAELDADDDLYDSMYEELHFVLRQRAQPIADPDDKIGYVFMEIYNVGRKNLTAEEVCMVVDTLTQHMNMWPADEERSIVHALVDSIEIYSKPLPSGLILDSVYIRQSDCDKIEAI